MAINISGLISGIDTDAIVAGLLDVQQKQIDQFNIRKQGVQARQGAYQTLEAQIAALRSTASQLGRSQNSPFDSRTVSVSHPDAIVATAASRSATGSYQITVDSLASAHQVASQVLTDSDAAITEGTFTIRVGDQPPAEITINSSNNTLSGLADAINFANVGVNASIVQDGGQARLLLTSSRTGAAHDISVTNNLAASSGGALRPEFDFDNPVQAAANAQVRLGSGPGALEVSSETNQITNLISGVTLSLLAADSGKTITVNVAQNNEAAAKAVQDFVAAYNGVLDLVSSFTKFNADSQEAGVLLGDRSINQIKNELQSTLQSAIPGLSTKANRLSALGITVNDAGKLVVNNSKLNDVIAGKVPGVSSADLRKLFSLDATSSSGNVQFVLGSSRTKDSAEPYQVVVTQAAQRGTITAAGTLAALTTIDSSNDELRLNLDGTDITVKLTHGDYTAAALGEHLQKLVNNHPDITGRAVSVGVNGSNQLTMTSDSYGASSRIAINSGTALSVLGFSGGEGNSGVDVAGHFVVNGKVEAATGRGRLLSGDLDNAFTADLQVRVTLSPEQITTDPAADLLVTRGLAARLDQVLGKMLSAGGTFRSVDESLNSQLDSIQKSLDRQQVSFDKQRESIVKQFTALESAIANLQNTSSLLGAQLANLSGIGS